MAFQYHAYINSVLRIKIVEDCYIWEFPKKYHKHVTMYVNIVFYLDMKKCTVQP